MWQMHSMPHAGYSGINTTIDKISQRFYWIGLKEDEKAYVSDKNNCPGFYLLLETSVLPKYIGMCFCIDLHNLLGKTARYFILNFFLSGHIKTCDPSVGLDVTPMQQKVTVSEITLVLNVTVYETTLG